MAASQAAKTGSNPVGDATLHKSVEIRSVGRISTLLPFPQKALRRTRVPARAHGGFFISALSIRRPLLLYPKGYRVGSPALNEYFLVKLLMEM